MNKNILSLASLLAMTVYFGGMVGCGPKNPPPALAEQNLDHDDHDHDDHDHDDHDHEGHDHPEHGPNGGHMVDLSGGSHAEWAHDDDKELLTVYPENPAAVTKVEMKSTIQGKTTVYPFAKADDEGQTVYTLTSPELLTAIKMGDAVATELVITSSDGEAAGKVVHHSH